jgi:hypothetical protein
VTAAKLLDRLARPRQTRPGAWAAGCPCCQSKRGRPISVRELDDGRVLLHAFCGCDTGAVLGALGLALSDLFPERLPQHSYQATHARIPAADLLAAIDHEVIVASLILNDVLAAGIATEAQRVRLCQAAACIGEAREHGRH